MTTPWVAELNRRMADRLPAYERELALLYFEQGDAPTARRALQIAVLNRLVSEAERARVARCRLR